MKLRSLYFSFRVRKILTVAEFSFPLIYSHHLLEILRQNQRWIISIIHCYCSLPDITSAFILNVELLTVFEIKSMAGIPPGARQSPLTVLSVAADAGRKLPQFTGSERSLEAEELAAVWWLEKNFKHGMNVTFQMCRLFVAFMGDSWSEWRVCGL